MRRMQQDKFSWASTADGHNRHAQHGVRNRDGFTLVEMLVTLAILGIILSATAAALITFTRQAVADERRFQATAVLTEVHEEFQALPWEVLATVPADLASDGTDEERPLDDPTHHLGDELVYTQDELDAWVALGEGGGPAELEPLRFRGDDGQADEIVTFVAEGTPEDVPRAYEQITSERDGREYEVYRIITWVDRDVAAGDTPGSDTGIKRLTAIVRWEILGQTFEERFVSERAPSIREAGDFSFPRLIQYDLFPTNIRLFGSAADPEEFSVVPAAGQEMAAAVRFSEPVDFASLRFRTLPETGAVTSGGAPIFDEQTVTMNPVISTTDGGVYFVASDVAAGQRFPTGATDFRVVIVVGGAEFEVGERAVNFFVRCADEPTPDDPALCETFASEDGYPGLPSQPGSEGSQPPEESPVTVNSITHPTSATLYRTSGTQYLCTDVAVDVSLSDLQGDETVTLRYTANGVPQSREIFVNGQPDEDRPTGTANFRQVFSRDFNYSFSGSGNVSDRTTSFTVQVDRGGSEVALTSSSDTLSFSVVNGKANCP